MRKKNEKSRGKESDSDDSSHAVGLCDRDDIKVWTL